MRGDLQKTLSPQPLNLCYPVFQWAKVRLIFIFKCILGFQSQDIDFTNVFYWADIPSGKPVLIVLPRYFNSDGGQCYVVLRLNKLLYGQSKDSRLWHEKLRNGLLNCGLVVIKVDTCMFMYKNVICVVYVYYCLLWARSQSDIDNEMKYFKEDGPS